MKKQAFIRVFFILFIVTAAFLAVTAAARHNSEEVTSEECSKDEQECGEKQAQSEFLLQSLTRSLLTG